MKDHYSDNPSIFVDDYNQPHLLIFTHFFIEDTIPKYQKLNDYDKDNNQMDIIMTRPDGRNNSSTYYNSNTRHYDFERVSAENLKRGKSHKISKFKRFINTIVNKKQDAIKTFNEVKTSFASLSDDLEEAYKNIDTVIKFLNDSGQLNHAKKLQEYKEVIAGENVLIKHNIKKYITEKEVIDFMLKSDNGVCITFLRYFNKILPLNIAKKKIELDKLTVFDNYCVLYYDETVDSFRYIKEEHVKDITKDPILFGMIKGSDKLYYICDWVYEDDDLTLEKLEGVLGKKAYELDDIRTVQDDIISSDLRDLIREIQVATRIIDIDNKSNSEKGSETDGQSKQ